MKKKYLYTFLEDDNIPIDNNRAENAIRPFAVPDTQELAVQQHCQRSKVSAMGILFSRLLRQTD